MIINKKSCGINKQYLATEFNSTVVRASSIKMASSYAHMPKTHQYAKKRSGESSSKTIVGLHKTEVMYQKMMDRLERDQNTSVNNIANHQQAMKMSWRRLEEKRTTSPLLTRQEKKQKEEKNDKKGLLLQSNTKLYVKGTPQVYNVDSGVREVIQVRPVTADDSFLGRRALSESRGEEPKLVIIFN